MNGGLEQIIEDKDDSADDESSEEFDEEDERFMNTEEKARLQKRRD